MANWAYTSYAVEGPKETLQKIEQAILHHPVEEGSSENWEGNILLALGIKWQNKQPDGTGYYMRGFILSDVEPCYTDKGTLRFDAKEAWGVTDFNEVLEKNLPVKVYYVVEEEGEEIYATNDKDGKYFKDRFYVDTCIKGNYQSEYFQYKSDVFKWLYELTNGEINTEEKVDEFNENVDESNSDDYIYIHEFLVV